MKANRETAKVKPETAPPPPQQPPKVELEREFSAKRINEVLNHPEVRPSIADGNGPVDITEQVRDPKNVLLMGKFGGCFCYQLAPGIYEVHTQVLPEGRGPWALAFVKAGSHFMFTKTDAVEIVTRVPHGHGTARTLSVAAGMQFELTRPDGCKFGGKLTAVDIFTLHIQAWVQKAAGLIDTGKFVHAEMNRQAKLKGIKEQPHENDDDHNRIVGAVFDMVKGGQIDKAAALYNRWALIARHPLIKPISATPPTIGMDIGLMRLVNGKIELVPC